MRKILILLVLPSIIFAQYWGERVTEKSFETSDIYFNSYYLNTFGLYQFKDVASGLLDDPFLRLQINPALLPDHSDSKTRVYLDFRGERTEANILEYNIYPSYNYDALSAPQRIIDSRWYSITRSEPEPVFSLGVLTYPLGERLFLGATYQMLYRLEPYYQTPTWIYNSRYGYGAYDDRLVANESDVPIIDRYSGSDEMLTTGQLISGFVGYKFTEKIQVGLNANSVFHDREGQYANLNADQYSTTDNSDWFNAYSVNRNQSYDHIDISGGISYQINEKWRAGIKLGQLYGEAVQDFLKSDSSVYFNNYNDSPTNWNRSYRLGETNQNWERDGSSRYGTLNFDYKFASNNVVAFYYSYRSTDIDLISKSSISDTSFYAGEWTSNYGHSTYESNYSFLDNRNSSGINELTKQEAMLSFHWRETKNATVFFGFYYSEYESIIDTREPVTAGNQSKYNHSYDNFEDDNDNDYNYIYSLSENKTLIWNYKAQRRTIQIPVLLNYHINKSWEFILGINRMWNSWEISDQTTALFAKRTKNQNGNIEEEENFGERYTQPLEKFTDNKTAFVAGMGIKITPKLKIDILVDPESEPDWRVSQWWLTFRANL